MRRKRVRVHFLNFDPSVEGILVSSFGDHYRLLKPALIEAPDRTHDLTGEVWIPRERVVFLEVI